MVGTMSHHHKSLNSINAYLMTQRRFVFCLKWYGVFFIGSKTYNHNISARVISKGCESLTLINNLSYTESSRSNSSSQIKFSTIICSFALNIKMKFERTNRFIRHTMLTRHEITVYHVVRLLLFSCKDKLSHTSKSVRNQGTHITMRATAPYIFLIKLYLLVLYTTIHHSGNTAITNRESFLPNTSRLFIP